MDPHTIDAILAVLMPEEIRDALWMIDRFERWDMPAEEAAEWRQRILARQRFLQLGGVTRLTDPFLPPAQ